MVDLQSRIYLMILIRSVSKFLYLLALIVSSESVKLLQRVASIFLMSEC